MLNELNWRSTQKPLIVKSQAISLQISQLHSAVQEFSLHDPSYHHRIDYLLAICDFDGVQRQTRIWARKVWGVGDIGLFNLMSNPSFTLPFFFAFIHLPISIWTCLQAISLRRECGVKWWVHGQNCHFCRHLQKCMCAHIHLQSAVWDGLAWKVFVICTSCMKVHLLFLFLFCFLLILKRRFKHRWVVLSPIRNGVWYWCDFMDLHTTQVTAALITTLSVLT